MTPWRNMLLSMVAAWLLVGSVQAQTPANTLVTGVVLDQNGRVANDPLVVRILVDKKKVAEAKSREGLFQVDLAGQVAPTAEIAVVIRPQEFEQGTPEKARGYGGASQTVTLAQAQNLVFQVNFKYSAIPAVVGPYSELPAR